jgi:hypothetical protein
MRVTTDPTTGKPTYTYGAEDVKFTPYPVNQATEDFFTSRGVEQLDDGRLLFGNLDGDFDNYRWTPCYVHDTAGRVYLVEARGASCGGRCRCAAEVRITTDTPQVWPREEN